MRDEIQRGSWKRGDIGVLSVGFDRLITKRTTCRIYGLTQWSKINPSLLRGNTDLCRSGVGLATAMLELLRLEGIGDFCPSVQL